MYQCVKNEKQRGPRMHRINEIFAKFPCKVELTSLSGILALISEWSVHKQRFRDNYQISDNDQWMLKQENEWKKKKEETMQSTHFELFNFWIFSDTKDWSKFRIISICFNFWNSSFVKLLNWVLHNFVAEELEGKFFTREAQQSRNLI